MNRTEVGQIKLELSHLSRTFGKDVKALDNFSISVQRGEFVSLLGPSGCGKTTALRIIAGLERQDSGSVVVDDVDISQMSADKRNMGMVFQQYSLFPNLNALENIAFGLEMRRVDKARRTTKAYELLDLVGLPTHAKRFPHQLSGGQQQRVALARAIAFEPEILLLDEPLSALDAQVRVQVREEIRRIQLQYGITTLFVTHDQEEAMAISDRVAVMREGRLEQIDAPEALYRAPVTSFVASFVGITNRIPGKVINPGAVQIFNQQLSVSQHSKTFGAGSSVDVLIRPENLHILKKATSESISGELIIKSFLGPYTTLGVKIDGMPLIHIHAESKGNELLRVGDEVHFSVHATNVMLA
jgi:putative spermidine/putrescine transport system ATP-binding protein